MDYSEVLYQCRHNHWRRKYKSYDSYWMTDTDSKERWWLFRLQCKFKSFGSNQSNRLKKDYRGRDPRTIQSADRSIRVSPRFSLFFGTGPARSFWFWVGPGPKWLNISYFSVVDRVLDRSVLVLGAMVEDVHDYDYIYSLIYCTYIVIWYNILYFGS